MKVRRFKKFRLSQDSMYYPPGTVVITSTNENPGKIYGGTWELVDKEYRPEASNYTMASSEMTHVSAGTIYYERSGHNVRLRIDITTNTSLADSDVELFKIDYTKFGIKELHFAFNAYAAGTDAQNAIIICNLAVNGTCVSTDVVPRGSGTTVASGAYPRINVTLPVQFEDMLDEFCDKFYWKKA